jgi:uncharacterized membrane protein YozB (DUF420 family)
MSKSKLSTRDLSAQPKRAKKKKAVPYGRMLYSAFLTAVLLTALSTTALAAPTIWDKAQEIMKDVYTQILAISTVAGIVTSAVALLLMNFSKNGKTVDESRSWLKRIITTWVILNSLGFVMAYVVPFFSGGKWDG